MNIRPRVAFTRRYPTDLVAALSPLAEPLMPADDRDALDVRALLRDSASIAAVVNQGELRIDGDFLAALPRLRIVANAAIGTNNFDPAAMRQHRIWGTNTPEPFAEATADCALGLLLMLARRLGEGDRFVRAGRWDSFAPSQWDGVLLRGRTLGLVGYGNIGRAVAQRARAFGLRIVHHTRTRTADPEWRPLDALLAEADFVSLHVPLNSDSKALIDARRLAQMKPGALLLNLARGPVVDEPALIEALRSGRLGGAALDVFADEPRVPAALFGMENVVLTPHLGGGSHEGRRLAQQQCVENVRRVLTGESPLPGCVVVAAN